jgi:hypothetical protein
MSQAKFAELCGVSAMMISKHKASGFVVLKRGKVDAGASLETLEGHLDETKRRAAVERLRSLEALAPCPPAPECANDCQAENVVPIASWRVQKDKADAQLRQLELAERTRQLVDAIEVRKAVEDAVTAFWSELDRRRRQETDEIATALGLDAENTRALRGLIEQRDRSFRQDYAEAMKNMAEGAAPDK